MAKKVNIIGAGLAGLSTGIYLQQSGVDTEIYELAGWAGGVCTAWVRGGYRFDGCIHWMVGTKSGDGFYEMYQEVGALNKDTAIYNADSVFMELGGVMYEVPMQVSKFRAFLHGLSVQDEKKIDEFCDDILLMSETKMPAGTPQNLAQAMKVMKESRGFLTLARKYLGKTVEDTMLPIQSKAIRDIMFALMPAEFSAQALVMMLGTRMGGNAGYPMGGALEMVQRMKAKYLALGGKIKFQTKVDEIVVENGKAIGLRAGESFYPADGVVAACDAQDTLQRMLGGKYVHPQLTKWLKEAPLFDPLTIVSFGLTRQFDIPYSMRYECPQGIQVAPGVARHSFSIRSFDFDPSAAPQGGSSVMVTLSAPLDYWQNLRKTDEHEYKKQKQQLSIAVQDAVEQRLPGFKAAVSVVDVATPATYVRLVNLYRASFEGFLPTPAALKTNIKKRVPGVKRFCICGQWTSAGGGICTAIADGKQAANMMIKDLK